MQTVNLESKWNLGDNPGITAEAAWAATLAALQRCGCLRGPPPFFIWLVGGEPGLKYFLITPPPRDSNVWLGSEKLFVLEMKWGPEGTAAGGTPPEGGAASTCWWWTAPQGGARDPLGFSIVRKRPSRHTQAGGSGVTVDVAVF